MNKRKTTLITVVISFLIIMTVIILDKHNQSCIVDTVADDVLNSYPMEQRYTLWVDSARRMQYHNSVELILGNITENDNMLSAMLLYSNIESGGVLYLHVGDTVKLDDTQQLEVLAIEKCSHRNDGNMLYGLSHLDN